MILKMYMLYFYAPLIYPAEEQIYSWDYFLI
jgi:hypothetical protein